MIVEKCPNCDRSDAYFIIQDKTAKRVCKCGTEWAPPGEILIKEGFEAGIKHACDTIHEMLGLEFKTLAYNLIYRIRMTR